MVGKNKDFVPTALKLRADLAARLEAYKDRTGVPKTFTIEKALEQYLDKVAPETKQSK